MRSPVSVVIANLVREDVEERALTTFHTPPPFWKRCVDDTFTALPKELVDPFLNHLNGTPVERMAVPGCAVMQGR